MKLPRNLDGKTLAKLLNRCGYEITRQTGSHVRLTTNEKGEHHVTIPLSSPLRVGTLNAILSDVAIHLNKSKEIVVKELLRK